MTSSRSLHKASAALLSVTVAGCGFFTNRSSVASETGASSSPTGEPSIQASASPSSSPAEKDSAAGKSEPEKSESSVSENPVNTSGSSTTGVSKGAAVRTMQASAADPLSEIQAKCAETWGTWVNGTGCVWTPASTASNTGSSSVSKQETLSPWEIERNRLNNEVLKAASLVASAKAELADAEAAYEAAKARLQEATGSLLNDDQVIEAARMHAGEKAAALELAKQNLSNAQQAYTDAVNEAAGVYSLAEAGADAERKAAVEQAEKEFASAKAAAEAEYDASITAAENLHDAALAAAEEARTSADAATDAVYQAKLSDAKKIYDDSVAEAREAHDARIQAAQESYDAAVAQAETAYEKAVAEAESDPEYLAAAASLKAAVEQAQSAQAEKQAADDALSEAVNAFADAQAVQKQKDDALQKAKTASETAAAAAKAAEQALQDAEAELSSARENDAAAQKAVSDAQTALSTAKRVQASAEADVQNAEAEKENADQQIRNANAALEAAKVRAASAQVVIDQGIMGFYETQKESDPTGYAYAKAVLDYASSASVQTGARTSQGGEGDATSLANIEKAIRYMEESNELRSQDSNRTDLSELCTTMRMMALAEANANATAYYSTHWQLADYEESLAGQADSRVSGNAGDSYWQTSENWAGGYSEVSTDVKNLEDLDPFNGWYEDEKAIYDYRRAHPDATDQETADALGLSLGEVQGGTGHYTNLISTSAKVTGAAVNDERSQSTVQEFDSRTAPGEKVYTVAEYKEMFLAYYTQVQKDLSDAEALVAEKQAALDELTAAKSGALNADGTAYDGIGLTAAQYQAIVDAQKELKDAEASVAEKTSILADANLDAEKTGALVTAAETAVTSAENEEAAKRTEAEAKAAALAEAEAQKTTADQNVNTAAETVLDRTDDADDAASALLNAEETQKEAEDMMETEQEAADAKSADEKEALDEAKNSTIVQDTTRKADADYAAEKAEAAGIRQASEDAASAEKAAAEQASAEKYNQAKADADSTLQASSNEAAETRDQKISDAEGVKQDAEASADAEYTKKVEDAKAEQNASDAAAEKKLAEARKTADQAEQELADAEALNKEIQDTSENLEKKTEAADQADQNLSEKETDLDRFLNPEKYAEKGASEKTESTPTEETKTESGSTEAGNSSTEGSASGAGNSETSAAQNASSESSMTGGSAAGGTSEEESGKTAASMSMTASESGASASGSSAAVSLMRAAWTRKLPMILLDPDGNELFPGADGQFHLPQDS